LPAPILSPDTLRQQLATPLAAHELLWGDDLERQERLARAASLRDASVLIPLVAYEGEVRVLFTQRTAHLHDHAGQISFPGGRREEADADATATALRETEEEIGLAPAAITVLGQLPEYNTGSGYRVTPIVGWSTAPVSLTHDDFEVAETFEVPLRFLLNPANHRHETAWVAGRERRYWAMPYRTADGRERFIWGVTAGILVMLSRVVCRKPET
jgi:8-oxo-dGTP pyrophosphatase MutT (NUDIX family)